MTQLNTESGQSDGSQVSGPDLTRHSDRQASRQERNLCEDFLLWRDKSEHNRPFKVNVASVGAEGRLLLGVKDCVNTVAGVSWDPIWRRQEERT